MSALPRIARQIAEATAILRESNDLAEAAERGRKWDESLGQLAPAEIAQVDPHTTAIARAYERALTVAQGARQRVLDSLTGDDSLAIWRAIDSYAVVSIALWRAAEAVCDCENLPNNGEEQGIVWRVPMLREDSPEQAGARIADDRYCRCGARGYRSLCPSCQREENEAGR